MLREKRGLSLAELAGGGSPSTAKSWEGGALPRPEKWDEIANRLGVSPTFLVSGRPTIQADFDFIAKHEDEIGIPKELKPRAVTTTVRMIQERRDPYRIARDTGEAVSAQDCQVLARLILARAGAMRGGLGHVYFRWRQLLDELDQRRSKDPLIEELRRRVAANPHDRETSEYLQHLMEDEPPEAEPEPEEVEERPEPKGSIAKHLAEADRLLRERDAEKARDSSQRAS